MLPMEHVSHILDVPQYGKSSRKNFPDHFKRTIIIIEQLQFEKKFFWIK